MGKPELSGSGGESPVSSENDQKNLEALVGNQSPCESQSANERVGQPEAFLSQGLSEHYTPIDSYEGRHRYDPKFQWTVQEEAKLVRKVRNEKSWFTEF